MAPRTPTGNPPGRPRSQTPRTYVARVRLTEVEHARYLAAARTRGLSLAAWLREAGLATAAGQLTDDGH